METGLYGSVPVKAACRAVWVSAGLLSQDGEHTSAVHHTRAVVWMGDFEACDKLECVWGWGL